MRKLHYSWTYERLAGQHQVPDEPADPKVTHVYDRTLNKAKKISFDNNNKKLETSTTTFDA